MMRKKLLASLICLLFIFSGFQIAQGISIQKSLKNSGRTEYWGLLIAVGKYLNHPDEDRDRMLIRVEELYDTLLGSENWDSSHIKKIKAEDATLENILLGLNWLVINEGAEDISLVYITTHGYSMEYDLPPFDEQDGMDEALIPYEGFENIYKFLSDDELNIYLSLLESKGVCVIIDSCHAGGFNDHKKSNARSLNDIRSTAKTLVSGFLGELANLNRVVLMSCEEDELSFGSYFSRFLIEGLEGNADVNDDNVFTAEEIFDYAEEILDEYDSQHPTILDLYSGELPITGKISDFKNTKVINFREFIKDRLPFFFKKNY